jgi:hypothetical protein
MLSLLAQVSVTQVLLLNVAPLWLGIETARGVMTRPSLSEGVTENNSSLDNSIVGGSLIWVDALVGPLVVEEVRHDLHDTGNVSGAGRIG